ncbi:MULTISPECIES: AraC family transcriptional regulator [Rhizobium]|uniref:Transcriptional regulator n=1 Tax=Rhizobium favelukesii TaxID=348824 RepID=W6RP44_9HYPH|nr:MULTISPECIES: AraC family transcriptional regulator [Rhizobium]MCA0805628.1 AraC family transcriptional regulator [Rhizobium sp. T1473]MCS0459211.1 AraC family transcriptional regulator [Rhizobium favelukesii]UFS79032.1 AraC family transcriptional regulator [Rhizobium sp. T136]CDM62524.1 transcriptional regulator [Rhizobium favelukesii]
MLEVMADPVKPTTQLLNDVTPFVARHRGTVGLPTSVPRLTLWTSTRATSPTPAVFEPMFYAVLRGTKVLTMGANRFELLAGACAASSFGLPYIHQLTGATPELPYVGISLHLDIGMLTRVMLDMPKQEDRWTCAVAAGDLNGKVGDAFARLVGLLATPDDVGVLAPHYEFELYYRLLQSSMGDTLRQIGQRNDRFQQLKTAADWLAANHSEPVVIPDLAASSGMSVTSFHRHFKAVTGFSPLAFQRHIRLLEARKLLAAGSSNVSRVAYEVGYTSPSQFSREYKSMFGTAPVADLQR